MLGNLFGKFSKDIAIDLGTANTLVSVQGEGMKINEPSVVAINNRTGALIAVGKEARHMIGKTPPHITTVRPLVKGIISDFEVTEKMLKFFIEKVGRGRFGISPRPVVVIGVPLDLTEVERKAVEDAAFGGGARQVFLVEEVLAAAMGARLPTGDSVGSMVVAIGGGNTEIAVISLNGVVKWRSIPIAGDEMNRNIVQYAREVLNLVLGEKGAEEVKMKIGSAQDFGEHLEYPMRGRDLLSGLPREITVTDGQIRDALSRSVRQIIESVKITLEITPPELAADIYERGLVLSGGGALLRGMDKMISQHADIPVRIADDPLTGVVRGLGMLLDDAPLLRAVALPSARETSVLS